MHSINPPLMLQSEIILEEMQQIGRRHGSTSEEVCTHPAGLEIVWAVLVGEYV